MKMETARRTLSRFVVALVLGVALPASLALATPTSYTLPHIDGGSMNAFASGATSAFAGFALGDACEQSTEIDLDPTGQTVAVTSTFKLEVTFSTGTPTHILKVSVDMTGTYSTGTTTTPPYVVAGTSGSLTVDLWPRNADCNYEVTSGCSGSTDDVAFTGTLQDHTHGVGGLQGGHVSDGDSMVLAVTASNIFMNSCISCDGLTELQQGSLQLTGWTLDSF